MQFQLTLGGLHVNCFFCFGTIALAPCPPQQAYLPWQFPRHIYLSGQLSRHACLAYLGNILGNSAGVHTFLGNTLSATRPARTLSPAIWPACTPSSATRPVRTPFPGTRPACTPFPSTRPACTPFLSTRLACMPSLYTPPSEPASKPQKPSFSAIQSISITPDDSVVVFSYLKEAHFSVANSVQIVSSEDTASSFSEPEMAPVQKQPVMLTMLSA